MSKRILFHRNALAIAAVSLALVACGSNNSSSPDLPTDPPVVDAFFAYVSARIVSLLDTAEPIPIDDVTATMPEATEPELIPATPT